MYAADSLDLARDASQLFSGTPRPAHFYDPAQLSGLEVAERLGAPSGEIAWDIYLFFDPQAHWGAQIPQPADWVHQMQNPTWADTDRLFQGDDLAPKLGQILRSLL